VSVVAFIATGSERVPSTESDLVVLPPIACQSAARAALALQWVSLARRPERRLQSAPLYFSLGGGDRFSRCPGTASHAADDQSAQSKADQAVPGAEKLR
jgi:hypothetical protein